MRHKEIITMLTISEKRIKVQVEASTLSDADLDRIGEALDEALDQLEGIIRTRLQDAAGTVPVKITTGE